MRKMDFVEDIVQNGGEVYIVGGTNRDRFFNLIHNHNKRVIDFDLLVRCLDMNIIQSIISKYGTCKEVGKSFGILTFKTNVNGLVFGKCLQNDKMGYMEFDIALPRKEISTGKGYKDFEIIADPFIDIKTDLSRRDSTINAMAVRIYSIEDLAINIEDVCNTHIIDPFDGRKDIGNKIWKAVGNPFHRFREDPTRIIRALRQCAELGLTLDEETKTSIISESSLLENIMGDSAVRIVDEFVRLVCGKFAHEHIRFIMDSGLWKDLGLCKKNGKRVSDDDIHKLCKLLHDSSFDHSKKDECFTVEQKMYIVLKYTIREYPDVEKWLKKYNLSAAPHFPSKMVKFILSGIKHHSLLSLNMNDLDMRHFIVKVGDVEYANSVLDVFVYEQGLPLNNRLVDVFNKNKNVILTVNDVNITGDIIAKEVNVEGRMIGKIKNELFYKIVNKEIENDSTLLREYLKTLLEKR